MDIGLALSGGGTKGTAHIGVLRALKEENIDIDYISGTSTGDIIYFINKDLKSSRAKLYDDIPSYKCCGRIDEIVRASCSLPGVYIPKIIDNNILVDGGTRMNTPVNILKKMGAKKVIAISFDGNKNENTSYDNIFSIAM